MVDSLGMQSFKGFWKSRKIPGLDFWESRDIPGSCMSLFTRCVRLISLYVLMKCQSLQNWNGTWNFELISTRKIIWNFEKRDVQIQHKFNIFLIYISNVILDIGKLEGQLKSKKSTLLDLFLFLSHPSPIIPNSMILVIHIWISVWIIWVGSGDPI